MNSPGRENFAMVPPSWVLASVKEPGALQITVVLDELQLNHAAVKVSTSVLAAHLGVSARTIRRHLTAAITLGMVNTIPAARGFVSTENPSRNQRALDTVVEYRYGIDDRRVVSIDKIARHLTGQSSTTGRDSGPDVAGAATPAVPTGDRGRPVHRSDVSDPVDRSDRDHLTNTPQEPEHTRKNTQHPPSPPAQPVDTGAPGQHRSGGSDEFIQMLRPVFADLAGVQPWALDAAVTRAVQAGWSVPGLAQAFIDWGQPPGGISKPLGFTTARIDALITTHPPRVVHTRPEHCHHPDCDPTSRLRTNTHGHAYRCPDCHPATAIGENPF